MAGLADDFRKRAGEYRTAANALVDAADLATNPQKQITAIVGHVQASLFDTLAEVLDYQAHGQQLGTMLEQRLAAIRQNSRLRTAAATATLTGNWHDFDRLVAELGKQSDSDHADGSAGGDAAGAGTAGGA